MGFVFRLEEYARYQERVGDATYLDVTRRTDAARIDRVWRNLEAVVDTYGAPWIAQVWTKDPGGIVARGGALLERLRQERTTLTAQITVTGLGGTFWEPRVPAQPFQGVRELAALLGGPEHLTWRYDPILPGVHQRERFARLAGQAVRLGIRRCVINFVAAPGRYSRVDARLAGALPGWEQGMPGYDEDWKAAVAAQIVESATKVGIAVAACAESAALPERVPGLRPAACGDYEWFVALSGRDPGRAPTSGSRRGCGCAAYFDVGLYGQWARCHRCLYCYAG